MPGGTSRAVTDMIITMSRTSPARSEIEDKFVFEDYNQRIAVAALTVLISVFGLVGNFLVLFAVSLSRKLQTKVNVFVVNLSVADSIICCVLPFNVVALLSKNGWPLSTYVCSSASGFLWIALGSGTVTLALIAFNRYYVIKNQAFDKAYTSKRIAFMIAFAWLYPTVLIVLSTNVGLGELGYSAKYKACLQDSEHPLSEYLSLFAGIVVFLPSLIVIIFCYIMIFVHIRKHHRHLIRLFIIGDGGPRNDTFHDSCMESPYTPRSPSRVQFTYPPPPHFVPEDTPDCPNGATPDLQESTPASPTPPSIAQVPTSPTADLNVEGGGVGRRTKSVSQELSDELSSSVGRRQAGITRNVFYVVCAFLMCLTPYGVAILIPNSDPGIPWVMLLLQFNTCVNPVIYALKHPTFGEVIPRIIRCDFANIPSKSAWLKKMLGEN